MRNGEDVVLSEAGNPVARLVVYRDAKQNRQPGLWEGQVVMAEDFDDDLSDEILAGFIGHETSA